MRIAIVLAGGKGTRLNSEIPKQYMDVNGKPVIAYCLDTIQESKCFDRIVVVCEQAYKEMIAELANALPLSFSEPGENRQLSIINALEDLSADKIADDSIVMIHDAARPLLPGKLIEECLNKMEGHDGVLPVIPMKDTVYELSGDGKVTSLLEREKIYAGQAPEFFAFSKYLKACRNLSHEKLLQIHGSTEPAILAKLDIVTVPGEEDNFKITTQADLNRFRGMV